MKIVSESSNRWVRRSENIRGGGGKLLLNPIEEPQENYNLKPLLGVLLVSR